MDEPSAPVPGLEEYVAARGEDLLRTAWLLTGDRVAAEELLRTALATVLPHWRRIAAQEAGHHDADVRRTMLAAYTSRRGRGRHDPNPREHATTADVRGGDEDAALRHDVLTALGRLPRAQRAVVVLRYFDDLSEAQAANALDSTVATVRTQSVRGLAALPPSLVPAGSGPLDPQWRLRDALARAAPVSPDVDGLAAGARGYAARSRRRRRAAAASLAAVVVVAAGGLALTADGPTLPSPRPTPTTTSSPSLPFQYCELPAVAVAPARSDDRPLSERYDAMLVCARTDEDSVWSGSLPPDDILTVPAALDLVRIAARDDGARCPASLPRGPAYRLVARRLDGTLEYLPNEALRCDGWEALSSYFVAVAEQRGDRTADLLDGSYLNCPPVWRTPTAARPTSVPRGTVLTTATICLHPVVEAPPTTVPVFRAMRGNVLGELQVAPINAELADHGTARERRGPCAQKLWRYVLRAVTSDGRLVELASSCPDQLELVGAPGTTLRLGPDAASLLRGSVLGS